MSSKIFFSKKVKVITVILGLITEFGLGNIVHAALMDRGGGLIYDSVLDITWLQDANYAKTSGYVTPDDRDVTITYGAMTWAEAVEWVEDLNYFDATHNMTWSNWRLPTIDPINGSKITLTVQTDGATDGSYNVSAPGSVFAGSTASELAFMYFNNLENLALYSAGEATWKDEPQSGWSHQPKSGPFVNLDDSFGVYVTNTQEDLPDAPIDAWAFNFHTGLQSGFNGSIYANFAWAVADGDIAASAVPIPSAIWLFGSGLLGILGVSKRRRG
jgi:hypothetical protein